MKHLLSKTLIVLAIVLSLGALFSGVHVLAAAKDDICSGVALTGSGCDPTSVNVANTSVNNTIKLVINIFSMIVGIVAVIMIIVGGFKYVISSGDSGNVTSAKNTILYALIGLIIVALAQVIVKFTLNKAAAPTQCTPPATLQADGSCA